MRVAGAVIFKGAILWGEKNSLCIYTNLGPESSLPGINQCCVQVLLGTIYEFGSHNYDVMCIRVNLVGIKRTHWAISYLSFSFLLFDRDRKLFSTSGINKKQRMCIRCVIDVLCCLSFSCRELWVMKFCCASLSPHKAAKLVVFIVVLH